MAAQIFYTGPGKVTFNGITLQPEGVSGPVKLELVEDTIKRGSAMFGEMWEQVVNQYMKLTVTPFDDWGNLGALYPAYLGVTTTAGNVAVGAGTGLLKVGVRPHDVIGGGLNGLAPVQVWRPDGALYKPVRAAITKHPSMKLAPGMPLFGGLEMTCLGDPAHNPGDSGFLITGSAITEGTNTGGAGAADPDTTGYAVTNFVNGKWLGAWGAVTGFLTVEGEDGWDIVPDIKYNTYAPEKLMRHMDLASANFMAKCRPVGPTNNQMLTKILAHTQGQPLGLAYSSGWASQGFDLVLTGPNSKTITLKNVEIKGAGFEFGGTKLGNGEIGFVRAATFAAGAPAPQLIFSA